MTESPVHICLAVWGEHHTDVFLRYALPSHLAPGNLPALTAATSVAYHIFASREAMARMTPNPAFRRVREMARIHLRPLPGAIGKVDPNSVDPADAGVKYAMVNRCYAHAMATIDRSDPPVLAFWGADLLFSDGTFSAWYRSLSEGADVVLTTSLNLDLDAASPILTQRHGNERDRSIAISGRQLVRLTLAHPHPLMRMQSWDRGTFSDCASYLYWPVAAKGWVVRGFQLHPVMMRIRPGADYDPTFTVDTNFPLDAVPDRARRCIAADSDAGMFVEMSSPAYMRAATDGQPWSAPRFADMLTAYRRGGQFAKMPEHVAMARESIRFHADDVDAAWTDVESRSESVISDIERYLAVRPERILL